MIWAAIRTFLGTVPWVQILLLTAVSGAVVFGAQRAILSFQQSVEIEHLMQEKIDIAVKDQRAIEQLSSQYAKNTQVITKQIEQKTWALAYAKKQLEAIRNVKPEDNGPTRNVIVSTLTQLREQSATAGN